MNVGFSNIQFYGQPAMPENMEVYRLQWHTWCASGAAAQEQLGSYVKTPKFMVDLQDRVRETSAQCSNVVIIADPWVDKTLRLPKNSNNFVVFEIKQNLNDADAYSEVNVGVTVVFFSGEGGI